MSVSKNNDRSSDVSNLEAELRHAEVAQAQSEMELKHTAAELASLQGRFDVQTDRLNHAEGLVQDLRTKLNEKPEET